MVACGGWRVAAGFGIGIGNYLEGGERPLLPGFTSCSLPKITAGVARRLAVLESEVHQEC